MLEAALSKVFDGVNHLVGASRDGRIPLVVENAEAQLPASQRAQSLDDLVRPNEY